ncbi:hypothetical protein [Amycolatopsis sp.]|uniref:hypothetical protein n=1 Tax=Amycolatopsis sp. TaxID=37632 RepID=UPI002BCBB58D|nr:hypothetical protein [Amycolatopsis sp.]HVV14564.1 hypothetical protein [Amycolatopsis sp.]
MPHRWSCSPGCPPYGIVVGALGGPRELEGVFSLRWADTILHGVTMLVAAVMGLYHRRRPAAVRSRDRFVAHRAP